MITLGIDLGTSAVKLALIEHTSAGPRVIGSASEALSVQRPHPDWSEQEPESWWRATLACGDALHASHPRELSACAAIGLSGQMHGATLLDADGAVLRPCILWNDGRSARQCREFEAAWPESRAVTGNLAMPGFTAPKLLWVREHERDVFARTATVLLPKAYLRLRLCGELIEEMSDASGTLWLDVGRREWSEAALAACGMTLAQMPRLVEGNALAGQLSSALCARWGMARAPLIAGGAGDNAAGAVAVGAVRPGDAFVSLGTSGVLWCTTAGFAPNTDGAVHAFCHAVPATWHQMGVLLNGASCLAWWAGVVGQPEADLLAELTPGRTTSAFFTPYLSGERTPHNDPAIRGAFAALDAAHTRDSLTLAVLEGVSYAMRDAKQALTDAGTRLHEADLLGGGARSPFWCQLMADVLGLPLHQVAQSELGCALGAAKLAAMAASGGGSASIAPFATRPERLATFEPRAHEVERHTARYAQWRAMYRLSDAFRSTTT
ncbi:MAG: xylulokinase [Gemmatimonadaceae bacterium]|nr:xylulokinase [Gemmatimonadaceae bacterium]